MQKKYFTDTITSLTYIILQIALLSVTSVIVLFKQLTCPIVYVQYYRSVHTCTVKMCPTVFKSVETVCNHQRSMLYCISKEETVKLSYWLFQDLQNYPTDHNQSYKCIQTVNLSY